MWERQGLPDLLRSLARDRKFEFDLERAAFALALQRLCAPGSDLAGSEWVKTVEAPGFEGLALQHFYRTAAFLAGVRQDLESRLFHRDLNLFNQTLEVVFIDTTSLYCYRDTETEWRKRGYSRDHRPDLPQWVLCVAVNATGWPIAWEIFPGNTADQKALGQVVELLRQRFRIRRVTVVADRGMISRDTITMLTEHQQAPFDYVLGCRMRRQKEVSEEVLARAGRYQPVADNLEVKEVRVGERRYVVCRNPQEAARDAAVREAILEKLRQKLAKQGAKAMVGNKGFARFLKVAKGSVSIDEEAVKRDARLDGKFVLTTNTELSTAEVAQTYKSLWRVERTFREQKSTLEVRPIYHHRDDTSMGHIVASFLALRLEVDLQQRLEEREGQGFLAGPDAGPGPGAVGARGVGRPALSTAHRHGGRGASGLRRRRGPAAFRGHPSGTGQLKTRRRTPRVCSANLFLAWLNLLIIQNYFLSTVEFESDVIWMAGLKTTGFEEKTVYSSPDHDSLLKAPTPPLKIPWPRPRF